MRSYLASPPTSRPPDLDLVVACDLGGLPSFSAGERGVVQYVSPWYLYTLFCNAIAAFRLPYPPSLDLVVPLLEKQVRHALRVMVQSQSNRPASDEAVRPAS